MRSGILYIVNLDRLWLAEMQQIAEWLESLGLSEHTEPGLIVPVVTKLIAADEIFAAYKLWCTDAELPKVSKHVFGRAICALPVRRYAKAA